MRRFFRWLFGVPVVLFVVAFAIANRRWVTLSLDPFSQDAPFAAIDLPLWLLFFAGIFVGLVVGWIASWFAQGHTRGAARDAKAQVALLQHELADLRKQGQPAKPQDLAPYHGGLP